MAIFNALHRATSTLKRHYPILRCMSKVPENTENGGPKSQTPNQRVTLAHLKKKHSNYSKGDRITVVTAYDYLSAVHLDRAGIDVCLVGDSASMVMHGHDTILPISLNEMLVHCRAVARGAKQPLLVGELPFGTYESSNYQAVETAVRVLKEGGMDAIKLGGRSTSRITTAKALVRAGIQVMGHVGLTPQDISVLEEVRPPGNISDSAVEVAFEVVKSAKDLEKAGCFSVVLECVPPPVAAVVTDALKIPTIGIRAGPSCSGQVLVYHDLLRMFYLERTDPDKELSLSQVKPESCKPYTLVGDVINIALLEYKKLVKDSKFRELGHSPYKISEREFNCLSKKLKELDSQDEDDAATNVRQKIDKGEIPCCWWNPSN